MRHPALPLLVPALALALAACEPMPVQPEFSPMIAPIGAGVGLPPPAPVTTSPVAGTFAPNPVTGPPIIEETLATGDTILPPATVPTAQPLDPSISAAVEATGVPPETSGTINTLPLGSPVIEPPLATVPGGPLPPPRFQGSAIGAQSSTGADSRAAPAPAPAPTTPGSVSTASSISVTPISATPSDLARPRAISDEQDFGAVSGRETIESDAERLARLRAARQEVAPEPIPARPTDAAPNIVAYALTAPNAVGEPIHRRSGLLSVARLRDACRRYPSPDRAQEAFLAAGGPRRDRQGLDPDGDGYVCGWDPAPFRRASN